MSEQAAEHAIRTAMLLVASPEQVYSELRSLPRDKYSFGHSGYADLDSGLLARNEPLINLAIAQTTLDTDVLRNLYDYAKNAIAADKHQVKYFYGLRVACLSNLAEPDLLDSRPPVACVDEAELGRIISDGQLAETTAVFLNPATTGLLSRLLTRTSPFAHLNESRWRALLNIAARNERLNIDDTNNDGPDLGAWEIQKAVGNLARIVPVSIPGAIALKSVLERINKHISAESHSVLLHMLGRWREWEYQPKSDQDFGWSEDLKSDVLALLGAVLGSYGMTDEAGKFSLGWIKNFDSADLSERCAFYSIERLTDEQMEAAYQKDGEYLLRSVFINPSVMWNRAQRNFIEERLPDYLVWYYKNHCKVFKKRHPDFDDSARSAELRENPSAAETILAARILALEGQVERLERSIVATTGRLIWGFIILAGLVILSRRFF